MAAEKSDVAAPASQDAWDLENVADAEFLNRVIYDPEWFDEDGELTPAAISITDLKKRGFSLNRDFVKEEVIRRLISDALGKQPNTTKGASISRFLAEDVRKLEGIVPNRPLNKNEQPKPEKLFSAHASPQPENTNVEPPFPANPAHAHILCRHGGDGTIRELRERLLPLLKNIITVDRFLESVTGAASQS